MPKVKVHTNNNKIHEYEVSDNPEIAELDLIVRDLIAKDNPWFEEGQCVPMRVGYKLYCSSNLAYKISCMSTFLPVGHYPQAVKIDENEVGCMNNMRIYKDSNV
jgi:hypothetical protein